MLVFKLENIILMINHKKICKYKAFRSHGKHNAYTSYKCHQSKENEKGCKFMKKIAGNNRCCLLNSSTFDNCLWNQSDILKLPVAIIEIIAV